MLSTEGQLHRNAPSESNDGDDYGEQQRQETSYVMHLKKHAMRIEGTGCQPICHLSKIAFNLLLLVQVQRVSSV